MMRTSHLRLFVFFCVACLFGAQAHAQMVPAPSLESIDAQVANAKAVVVGKVSGYRAEPIENSGGLLDVTIAVEETFKGAHTDPLHVRLRASPQLLEMWKSNGTRVLVGLHTEDSPYASDMVMALQKGDLLTSKEDFTFIRDPESLLRYVREIAKRGGTQQRVIIRPHKGAEADRWKKETEGLYPGGLVVPVDAYLEKWALDCIRSPDVQTRVVGIQHLAFFKSEKNILLLKSLLKDRSYQVYQDASSNKGIERRQFVVREQAYYTLTGWQLTVPQPEFGETVSRLDSVESLFWQGQFTDADLPVLRGAKSLKSLTIYSSPLTEEQFKAICEHSGLIQLNLRGCHVTDAQVVRLLGLKKLRSLDVGAGSLSDRGLKTLAKLPSLKELDVSLTEVTNAGLNAFRHARPDVQIKPDHAISAIDYYAGRGDVDGMRRILAQTPEAIHQQEFSYMGYSPLHTAVAAGRYEAAELLLDRGADVNASSYDGKTPLWIATNRHPIDGNLIQLLMGRGANVDSVDEVGVTPLHGLLLDPYNYNEGAVRLLLTCGANPLAKDHASRTPLQLARDHGTGADILQRYADLEERPAVLAAQTQASCNRIVYTLAPSQAALANWSSKALGALTGPLRWSWTPSGRSYIGRFGQQAVTLKLTGLPPHKNVHLDLELFIVGSWDGNGGLGEGPDILDIQVPNVGTLLHSTFFNNNEDEMVDLPQQSFPDAYGAGFHRGYTGADQARSLGFLDVWDNQINHRDAVYKLHYTFAHEGSEMEIVFSGLTVPQGGVRDLGDDETWGIGGLVVRTD